MKDTRGIDTLRVLTLEDSAQRRKENVLPVVQWRSSAVSRFDPSPVHAASAVVTGEG